jgi:predicted membrane metal-binding protein
MRILLMAVLLVLGGHILIGAVAEILGGRRSVGNSLGWLLLGIGLILLGVSGLWRWPLPAPFGYTGIALIVAGLFVERRKLKLRGRDG